MRVTQCEGVGGGLKSGREVIFGGAGTVYLIDECRSLIPIILELTPSMGDKARYLLIFFLSAGLVVLLYHPLFPHLNSKIIGGMGDAQVDVWSIWYSWYAITHREPFFDTKLIFAPFGAPLGFHTYHSFLNIRYFLLAPFGISPIAGHNLIHFSSFLLTFWGMITLLGELARKEIPGRKLVLGPLAAALWFTCAPWRISHSVGLHFNGTEIFPWSVWAYLRWRQGATWPFALIVSGLLAATFYTDLNYLVFLLLVLFFLEGSEILGRKGRTIPPRKQWVTIVLVYLILLSPWLAAMSQNSHGSGFFLSEGDNARPVLDLGFLVYPRLRILQGFWDKCLPKPELNADEYQDPSVGWMGFLILGIAFILPEFRSRWWKWLAVFSLIMSCGYGLKFFHWSITIPMPYEIIPHLPIIREYRVPGRLLVVFVFSSAILTGLVVASWEARLRQFQKLPFLGAASILVVVIGLIDLSPIPTLFCDTIAVPKFYYRIGGLEPGTLLDIPFGLRSTYHLTGEQNGRIMAWQFVHQKPLLSGHVSRYPRCRLVELYVSEPFFVTLLKLQENFPLSEEEIERGSASALAFKKKFRLKYVLIDQDRTGMRNPYPHPLAPLHLERLREFLVRSLPMTLIMEEHNRWFYEVKNPGASPEASNATRHLV